MQRQLSSYETAVLEWLRNQLGNMNIKNVQNVLGFLLAGFGGILSFFGLRSTEVTTVLRNKSVEASLIALILLIAVLVAVVSVAVPDDKKVPLPRVAAIFLLLLGTGALVIFAIPIDESHFSARGVASLIIGCLLMLAAIYVWISVPDDWDGQYPQRYRQIPMQLTFIIASVMLLASSSYGAMRLETDSQLSSSVQVWANIVRTSTQWTLSVHITGNRIKNTGYVGISALGLPSSVVVPTECASKHLGRGSAPCPGEPCAYLKGMCQLLMDETVPPDANGNINLTLSDGILPGSYQDVSVRAVLCSLKGFCYSVKRSGSTLDFHLSKFPSA